MRQRITFFVHPGDSVDPSQLNISDTTLAGRDIKAAREDRITIALDELPDELHKILTDSHELHIRWISPQAYEVVEPLLSRLSAGFHLFYTPQSSDALKSTELCTLLQALFGKLDCSSPKTSFTELANGRFSHSTAFQYYQPLETLDTLIEYANTALCPDKNSSCRSRVLRLKDAISFDVSYDAISHALKATALWPRGPQPLQVEAEPGYRTEVGILAPDSPATIKPHELGIAGHLIVLGQDKAPKGTLFTFPSRHRNTGQSFTSKFVEPTGLHPVMRLQFNSNQPPVTDAYCSAHVYLTLPRTIFADKYQLGDDLFLQTKNLTALRHITSSVDLEAPDYATKLWGSAALLELAPPSSERAQSWAVEIPLHLRYLTPAAGGYSDFEVPYPAVFWACNAEEGTKFPTNPFERVNLGYDGLFGPRTVFWHVDPQPVVGSRLMSTIRVPVLDTQKAAWVNIGTAMVVFLGFAWVVWKLVVTFLRAGYIDDDQSPTTVKGEDKKTR